MLFLADFFLLNGNRRWVSEGNVLSWSRVYLVEWFRGYSAHDDTVCGRTRGQFRGGTIVRSGRENNIEKVGSYPAFSLLAWSRRCQRLKQYYYFSRCQRLIKQYYYFFFRIRYKITNIRNRKSCFYIIVYYVIWWKKTIASNRQGYN